MIEKLFSHHAVLTMGIVNITPNSFSDGGFYNNLESLEWHVTELLHSHCHLIDFGAESTAPSSDPIDRDTEILRFKDSFFPYITKCGENRPFAFSIDTYRPEVFKEVYCFIKRYIPDAIVIFNDISGVIDKSLVRSLEDCSDSLYIYNFTYIPHRQKSSLHMDFTRNENIEKGLVESFNYALEGLKKFKSRLILDPGLGFSKTLEQNLDLIKGFSSWSKKFDLPFLLGLSKKSFLQNFFSSSPPELRKIKSEWPHFYLVGKMIRENPGKKLIFRVHDPDIVNAWSSFFNEFDH